jgi:hypothetical protein
VHTLVLPIIGELLEAQERHLHEKLARKAASIYRELAAQDARSSACSRGQA